MSAPNPPAPMSEPTDLKPTPNPTTATATSCCRHCQTCHPSPILSTKTLKTLLWYLAIGFAANPLSQYLSANFPLASFGMSNQDSSNSRSICLSRDNNSSCVSWASYIGSGVEAADADSVTGFSVECALSGGVAEFKSTMSDGGLFFVCVK